MPEDQRQVARTHGELVGAHVHGGADGTRPAVQVGVDVGGQRSIAPRVNGGRGELQVQVTIIVVSRAPCTVWAWIGGTGEQWIGIDVACAGPAPLHVAVGNRRGASHSVIDLRARQNPRMIWLSAFTASATRDPAKTFVRSGGEGTATDSVVRSRKTREIA